jgi:chemotaxis protein MotB
MRRRKRKEEHISRERWLVSYADFITLLSAFFVVLYASSQVDKRKVGRLAMAIQVAFQELGVFDTSNTKIPLSDSEAIPFSSIQSVENLERTSDISRIVQPMKGMLGPPEAGPPLKDVQAELEKALAPEIAKKFVDIKAHKEGLIVSLREMGFYESGSASIRGSSLGAIDRLAAVIAPRGEALRIEGHSDNVPIHNARFASNWELSTARATELIKLFIERYHMPPARLSASGFAEFHPVSDNLTADGRARNRRVDIVILNPLAGEKSPFAYGAPVRHPAPTIAIASPAH